MATTRDVQDIMGFPAGFAGPQGAAAKKKAPKPAVAKKPSMS
jgi:hypothetical protein